MGGGQSRRGRVRARPRRETQRLVECWPWRARPELRTQREGGARARCVRRAQERHLCELMKHGVGLDGLDLPLRKAHALTGHPSSIGRTAAPAHREGPTVRPPCDETAPRPPKSAPRGHTSRHLTGARGSETIARRAWSCCRHSPQSQRVLLSALHPGPDCVRTSVGCDYFGTWARSRRTRHPRW
jgi:hypothetical protein